MNLLARLAALVALGAAAVSAQPSDTEGRRSVLMAKYGDRSDNAFNKRVIDGQLNGRRRRTYTPSTTTTGWTSTVSGVSCSNPSNVAHCGQKCGGKGHTGPTCCRPGQVPKVNPADGMQYCSYTYDTCGGDPYTSSDRRWKQCGGLGWTGETCCPADFQKFCINQYYCVCWPLDTTQCGATAWKAGCWWGDCLKQTSHPWNGVCPMQGFDWSLTGQQLQNYLQQLAPWLQNLGCTIDSLVGWFSRIGLKKRRDL